MKDKILVTGSEGRLGSQLMLTLDNVVGITHSIELSHFDPVIRVIDIIKPNIIINCAGRSGEDLCYNDQDTAHNDNVLAVVNLIDAIHLTGNPDCYFVQISTPNVFDGKNPDGYYEDSESSSKTTYGMTKAVAEIITQRTAKRYCIARINFQPKARWQHEYAFTDRIINPLWSCCTANALKDIIQEKPEGIIHIAGNETMSLYDLARRCPDGKYVKPITMEEFYKSNPLKVRIPQNVVLKSTRWKTYDMCKGQVSCTEERNES